MVHGGSTTPATASQATGSSAVSDHTAAALRVEHALYPKEADVDVAIRARVGAWFVVLESISLQRVQDFFASAPSSVLELAHLDELTQQQLQVPLSLP